MNVKTGYRQLLRLLPAGALIGTLCTTNSVDSGGSSGTEISKATGVVTDRSGSPVSDVTVRLRPARYLSASSDDSEYQANHSVINTFTDAEGAFALEDLMPDRYLVEVNYLDSLGSVSEFQIDCNDTVASLPILVLEPMSEITGHIEAVYFDNVLVTIQVYGLDRSASADTFGNFELKVPQGKHLIHIGAMFDLPTDTGEFDGMDLALEVYPGEQRYAGSFIFRPPPPESCPDGECDSSVVRMILESANRAAVWPDGITKTENGRIVTLNLRGFDLSNGIPFDINRLIALRHLDLGATGLPSMHPDIGKLEYLETVRLDSNMLEYFATTAGKLSHLRILDLSDNRIGSLHESLLGCPQLDSIDIGNNKLCQVNDVMSIWLDTKDPDWRETQRCK
ncbi:MAG: carboxypeptidase regulatory-like domain-containing protein [Chitinispirillaceae bacterium]|nr:carboxypeptidase regulatory-like domain-containing protein [Chitinispirillaceae bacterium]